MNRFYCTVIDRVVEVDYCRFVCSKECSMKKRKRMREIF